MSDYQVIARKYRPQTFAEVLGQAAIVITLKNAIKHERLAHAYLFCGSRGTGKTTLARVFAKALNCQNPSAECEPCNHCASCKEIAAGNSLDVLEIDGASHRGIDDIRQINDTVAYATVSGKYKIYIIDEVHMLTKEAFNALLKTLEEPPPKVKFFFATTEPHKVLPTILSRCQRFNLNRIAIETITEKLARILKDLDVEAEEEALSLIANRADGGLRDAESLLDQIMAFHEGKITAESVASILGVMPRDSFFALDQAGKEGNLAIAFEMTHQIFSEGKDLIHFVEGLTEHFRNILMVKLSGKEASFLSLSEKEKEQYASSAKLYRKDQCLDLLDFLIGMQDKIRFMPSPRIALESILLHVLRSHRQLPIEFLVKRLTELEDSIAATPQYPASAPLAKPMAPQPPPKLTSSPAIKESIAAAPTKPITPQAPPKPASSTTHDPTPTAADLGFKSEPKPPATPTKNFEQTNMPTPPAPVELGARPTPEAQAASKQEQNHYDTLLQFAAVELEGKVQKNQNKRY